MRITHLVTAAAVALSATACGYSIQTAVDYDRTVNFGRYNTFYIMKGNSSGNPLLDQRAAEDVRQTLAAKGWQAVPEGEARATVVVHAATKTNHTYETLYDGFGGGWGWRRRWGGGGFGSSTTYVENYKVGTVVVDIFDTQTKQAIWHGTASDALGNNAKDNAQATAQAITKMFTDFPPGAPAN